MGALRHVYPLPRAFQRIQYLQLLDRLAAALPMVLRELSLKGVLDLLGSVAEELQHRLELVKRMLVRFILVTLLLALINPDVPNMVQVCHFTPFSTTVVPTALLQRAGAFSFFQFEKFTERDI